MQGYDQKNIISKCTAKTQTKTQCKNAMQKCNAKTQCQNAMQKRNKKNELYKCNTKMQFGKNAM